MKRFNPFYSNSLFLLGGYINALAIILLGRNIGVQTGNLSNIFIDFIDGAFSSGLSLLLTVVSFTLGSVVMGFVTANDLPKETHYKKLFKFHFMSSVVFFIILFVGFSDAVTLNLLSFYMGMQNALPFPSQNNRVRTTSMTGLVTGSGMKIGIALRNKDRKLFSATITSSLNLIHFMIGVSLAALLNRFTGIPLLLFAAVVELLLSFYLLYKWRQPKKEL